MANRIEHKPNPAIKKNVRRARLGAQGAKRAQTFVVTASLALTMMGWALFSHQEAQTFETAQLASATGVAVVVQQTASITPTPESVAITQSSR